MVFHSTVFLFSFTAHCCFIAILKTSADANAGQNYRLTHCLKNLHCYNPKLLIFKLSLLLINTFKNTTQLLKTFFSVSQSLTNAISLPLIYSISSKHVSDFSAPPPPPPKKKKNLTFPPQFSPPHPGKGQIPTPGRPCKSNSPLPGTENGQMPKG